jgi:surface protein
MSDTTDTTHELAFTRAANLTAIADAIRAKRRISDRFSPPQMAPAIDAIRLGIPIVVDCNIGPDGEWHRPAAWPDLDALVIDYAGDEEVLYLTYDNSRLNIPEENCWIGLYIQMDTQGAHALIERGTVSGGQFFAAQSAQSDPVPSATSGIYFAESYAAAPDAYPVYRITPVGGHFRALMQGRIPTDVSGLAAILRPVELGVLERRGNLPWIANIAAASTSSTLSNHNWGDMWMQRDATRIGTRANVTTLSAAWYGCYSLQSLDLSGWDTTGWAVTNLAATWSGCYSLQALDLSGWDTTGWAVTTLNAAWQNCYSLQALDLSGWDTTGWAVTSLGSAWASCYSLQALDLSGWDTTGWAVTTLNAAWQNCYSLQSLDLGGMSGALDQSIALSSSGRLSRDALLGLIAALPPTTAARTLTLHIYAYRRLTAADLAAAIERGWTVAGA